MRKYLVFYLAAIKVISYLILNNLQYISNKAKIEDISTTLTLIRSKTAQL